MKFAIALATLFGLGAAVMPLEIKGNRFVRPDVTNSTATEFTIVGVDYQPGGSSGYSESSGVDALSDANICLRDAYMFQQLGVNTIRVYTVNPWVNHDECMTIFNDAGIYVILDVNSPTYSIYRKDPWDSYNEAYLNQVFGVIDAFKGYSNVIGFFSGNEVVNDGNSAKYCPPYIRAVQRDMKQYIAKHASRQIPVGYSAADDIELREAMWLYLSCGDDESNADFFGLNSYQWCTGSTWQSSGYSDLLSTFNSTSIPLFLSEYGCNTVSPRTFPEVSGGVYGELLDAFSGGLVYEYSQETSNYGLVTINSDGSVKERDDFVNLKSAYGNITLPDTDISKISTVSSFSCSTAESSIKNVYSGFNSSMTLPDCPAKSMLENGGGNTNIGKFISLSNLATNYTIEDVDGNSISDKSISINASNTVNGISTSNEVSATSSSSSSASSTSTSGASSTSTSKSKAAGNALHTAGAFTNLLGLMIVYFW